MYEHWAAFIEQLPIRGILIEMYCISEVDEEEKRGGGRVC